MASDSRSSAAHHDISTPALELEEFDLSALGAIKDRGVLAKLLWARKIGQVDYRKAVAALNRQHEPAPHLQNAHILYSQSTPPAISPEEVLTRLQCPHRLIDSTQSLRVDKISDTMIVKHGTVDPVELETMLFVKQHTRIPIPAVHLLFALEGRSYLVIEYVPGGDLQHLWPSLQETERQHVLSQLQQYVDNLRSITPPSPVPGPIGGGVCRGRWFSDFGAGPFKSHQELVDWWNSKFPPVTDRRGDASNPVGFQADHPLVFTHGDLAPRNLILHEGVVWVVDWEQAGWYPGYLEYTYIASETGDWEYPTPKDWRDALLALIPRYEREHEMLKGIYPRIARGFEPVPRATRGPRAA